MEAVKIIDKVIFTFTGSLTFIADEIITANMAASLLPFISLSSVIVHFFFRILCEHLPKIFDYHKYIVHFS